MSVLIEKYSDKDFEQLYLPVHTLKDKDDPTVRFPQLNYYPEFRQPLIGVNPVHALKFVVYMFDRRSPLLQGEPNPTRRKMEAAILAGFKVKDDGTFTIPAQGIMRYQNTEVNAIAMRYVMFHNSSLYSLLTSLQISYERQLIKLTIDDVSAKESSLIYELQKKIEVIAKELVHDDNYILKEELFRYIAQERLELSPEFIARKMKQGEEPVKIKKISKPKLAKNES